MKTKYFLVASLTLAVGFIDARALAVTPGEADFRKQCANCHSLTPGASSIAPDLAGVVGRKAGSVRDYQYTPALRNVGFVWTPEKLTEWLAAPHNAVPETEMAFPGIKNEKVRAEIVEFLKQRHAK